MWEKSCKSRCQAHVILNVGWHEDFGLPVSGRWKFENLSGLRILPSQRPRLDTFIFSFLRSTTWPNTISQTWVNICRYHLTNWSNAGAILTLDWYEKWTWQIDKLHFKYFIEITYALQSLKPGSLVQMAIAKLSKTTMSILDMVFP